MVQSIIHLEDNEDRILNIVKAKHGFKNKSQAVAFIANKYSDTFLEPELRPEFIKVLGSVKNEKGIEFRSVEDLRKSIEKNA